MNSSYEFHILSFSLVSKNETIKCVAVDYTLCACVDTVLDKLPWRVAFKLHANSRSKSAGVDDRSAPKNKICCVVLASSRVVSFFVIPLLVGHAALAAAIPRESLSPYMHLYLRYRAKVLFYFFHSLTPFLALLIQREEEQRDGRKFLFFFFFYFFVVFLLFSPSRLVHRSCYFVVWPSSAVDLSQKCLSGRPARCCALCARERKKTRPDTNRHFNKKVIFDSFLTIH